MATLERGFAMLDRYHYDFGKLTYANGWAQIDTRQDASYFGNWVNPAEMRLFSYVEGDTTLTTCADEADFQKTLRGTLDWYTEHDGQPAKIDALATPALAERLTALGFAADLH